MVLFKNPVKIRDIAYEVCGVSTISNPQDNTLIFVEKRYDSLLMNLTKTKGCCVILEQGIAVPRELTNSHKFVVTDNPRLMFTRIYGQLVEDQTRNRIESNYRNLNGAIIGDNVNLGKHVVIEPLCLIDHGVTIGNNTTVKAGSRIRSRVRIGENCIIKENAVIGSSGFSFERGENGDLLATPQLGGVIIRDYVEIGALCTVASGTIDPTILGNQVKLNDHVHIAHNVQIDECTIVGAGTTISGSTKIGRNVWIAPNCAIMNQIAIGDGAVIGLSARIQRSVPAGVTMINERADTFENVTTFVKYKCGLFEAEEVQNEREVGPGHPLFK